MDLRIKSTPFVFYMLLIIFKSWRIILFQSNCQTIQIRSTKQYTVTGLNFKLHFLFFDSFCVNDQRIYYFLEFQFNLTSLYFFLPLLSIILLFYITLYDLHQINLTVSLKYITIEKLSKKISRTVPVNITKRNHIDFDHSYAFNILWYLENSFQIVFVLFIILFVVLFIIFYISFSFHQFIFSNNLSFFKYISANKISQNIQHSSHFNTYILIIFDNSFSNFCQQFGLVAEKKKTK